MKRSAALIGGLAGASALTLLHETARKHVYDAPRMDKMGMEATEKVLNSVDAPVPDRKNLYWMTLAGDIIGNALYYSKVSAKGTGSVLMRGAMLGLAAGISAVYLPDKIGLDDEPSNRTDKTKAMTVAWYLVGGLVAAGTALLVSSGKKKKMAL